LTEQKVISFHGCLTQLFFYSVFVTTEAFFLAIMAYDRCVAIRWPLHYLVVVSRRVCMQLVVGSYVAGSLNALVHTTALLQLSFCGPNVLKHFYCEIPPLLQLSCTDTWLNRVLMLSCAGFLVAFLALAILVSYTFLLLTVCSIRSAQGRHKAFFTCTSHLTALSLFCGSAAFLYLHPLSSRVEEERKTASVFYTVVTPMLNPFIYSLRNTEVRSALSRAVRKVPSCSHCQQSPFNHIPTGATHHSRSLDA
ncbi:olfactory receptor-like protein COR9, partial [Phasianus colchicus]|uniref:olfactory receptor-like protein COR9 n=1 Tax=Phasianus colchicus TaxID=9054 RepID=UPI00129E9F45